MVSALPCMPAIVQLRWLECITLIEKKYVCGIIVIFLQNSDMLNKNTYYIQSLILQILVTFLRFR